jgi:hypothetical protein
MVPKASGGDDTTRKGRARVKPKGGDWWRCEEGRRSRLPFIGPRGGAGAAPMAVELGGVQ